MTGVLNLRDFPAGNAGPGRIAEAAAMKKAMIIGSLLLAAAGCTASPGPAAGAHTAGPGGTCSHPFPQNHAITACAYPGGLYSVSYRDENQYYWHPAKGDLAVAETFYKLNAPGRAVANWTGRTISIGDSCVISDDWIPSEATPPSDCMDSRTGELRGATGEEQRSVLAFWRVMMKYIPAAER